MSKPQEMSFLQHLEVLRWHLIRCAVAVFLFAFVAFLSKSFVFDYLLLLPKNADFITYRLFCSISNFFGTDGLCIEEIPFTFQSLAMAEQFNVHVWTSITFGFIVAFPYIVFEAWRFISPGLIEKERKNAKSFIAISSLLFFVGVLFGYFILAPLSINFLGNYSVSDEVARNIKLSSYISLIRASLLASGFIFELPVIIYFLSKIGLITPAFMKTYRKHALVLVLLLSAVITPPDVISQIIVAIPIVVLYEFSILIAKRVHKKVNAAASNQKSVIPID